MADKHLPKISPDTASRRRIVLILGVKRPWYMRARAGMLVCRLSRLCADAIAVGPDEDADLLDGHSHRKRKTPLI